MTVSSSKAYCYSEAQNTMLSHNCHSGAILKDNMKHKNKDKDKWISKVRSPFESIFSKDQIRARYRGIMKVQMQVYDSFIVRF